MNFAFVVKNTFNPNTFNDVDKSINWVSCKSLMFLLQSLYKNI